MLSQTLGDTLCNYVRSSLPGLSGLHRSVRQRNRDFRMRLRYKTLVGSLATPLRPTFNGLLVLLIELLKQLQTLRQEGSVRGNRDLSSNASGRSDVLLRSFNETIRFVTRRKVSGCFVESLPYFSADMLIQLVQWIILRQVIAWGVISARQGEVPRLAPPIWIA